MQPLVSYELQPKYGFQQQSTDRAFFLITITVLFTHLSLLIASALLPDPKPIAKPIKQIIVKTITLGERPPPPKKKAAKQQPIVEPQLIVEAEPIPQPEPISKSLPKEEPAPIAEVIEPFPPIPETLPVEEKKPEQIPIEPKQKKPALKKETPKKKPTPPKPAEKTKTKPKAIPDKKEPKKTETPKKTKPPSKKETPKKETPKKDLEDVKPKAKETPAKPKVDPELQAANAKRRELLARAQKSIAKIEQNRDTLNASSATTTAGAVVPGRIDALQVETFPSSTGEKLSPQEISYYDELASRLKLLLRLPELGEIKIKLTLDRSGHFMKVTIVNAESLSNRKYVEKTLPTLTYPSFGSNFTGMAQYTFVISLSNELS